MKKVFVGLSGGVDSAVSAALLKEQGHDVTGVFIKIWQPEFLECTWREDRLDAMRVAAALGIPFLEVDFSDAYKKEVVDSMLASYERGETPNPDVLCNKSIKFGAFAKWASDRGADAIATGHYARINKMIDSFALLRGTDASKDQSYFLHRLSGRELPRVMFPIGALEKTRVRSLARTFGLPVAARPDSQGLCFVGDVSMSDFLRRFITLHEGALLDTKGRTIGVHEGAALYTIGQRHGFFVTGEDLPSAPHYVTAVDTKKNTVTVSRERSDAARASVEIEDMHWIRETQSKSGSFMVQTRYRETPVKAELEETGGSLIAHFETPHIVSPGQSLVFYSGDVCLGGGRMRPARAAGAFVNNSKEAETQTVQ